MKFENNKFSHKPEHKIVSTSKRNQLFIFGQSWTILANKFMKLRNHLTELMILNLTLLNGYACIKCWNNLINMVYRKWHKIKLSKIHSFKND